MKSSVFEEERKDSIRKIFSLITMRKKGFSSEEKLCLRKGERERDNDE